MWLRVLFGRFILGKWFLPLKFPVTKFMWSQTFGWLDTSQSHWLVPQRNKIGERPSSFHYYSPCMKIGSICVNTSSLWLRLSTQSENAFLSEGSKDTKLLFRLWNTLVYERSKDIHVANRINFGKLSFPSQLFPCRKKIFSSKLSNKHQRRKVGRVKKYEDPKSRHLLWMLDDSKIEFPHHKPCFSFLKQEETKASLRPGVKVEILKKLL